MKSSCISWPEKEPLVLIRASQVRLCEGNHCAAALLSYFEYWHNIRVDQAEQAEHHNKVAAIHGEAGMQDTSLLQYHTEQKIEEGLLHLYGRSTIRKGIALLVDKGFLSLQLNPNPKFHFDRTHYFLFHPDIVQREVRAIYHDVKVTDGGAKNNAPSVKNNAPIEEITSEITDRDKERERERTRDVRHIVDFEEQVFSSAPRTRCPVDFVPDPTIRPWAADKYPQVDFDDALAAMKDYEFQRSLSDWNAALKTWIRREAKEFAGRAPRTTHRQGYVNKAEQRQEKILSNHESLVERTKAYEARRRGQVLPGTEEPRALLPRHTD